MLIETEIVFTDESQSNLMGKIVNKNAPFVFDLNDVCGVMPGDENGKTSIIFLSGKDLLINLPYDALAKKYKLAKKEPDLQLSHEG